MRSHRKVASAFLELSLRSIVYIDGFNLYYGALKANPSLKWINPRTLVELIFPSIEIMSLKYFTANVTDRLGDLNQSLCSAKVNHSLSF